MDRDMLKDNVQKLVPANYLEIALNARTIRERNYRILLEQKKLPISGWDDSTIEEFVNYLSSLDSNNFPKFSGLGEREARIVCKLVAKRSYNFGHGIGRSGDLLEPQPKAAGSTLMAQLTNALLLDLIHAVGIRSCKYCFLVPMATGMTLSLCFSSLRKSRPNAKYILWSRIDQKACFKSITSSGFIPVIIQTRPTPCGLATNLEDFENKIIEFGIENILCIFSTTSCFAPRLCDDIIELAQMATKYNIPHVVNNAYGLQSTFLTHQIEQASKVGRVDLFVQSTDKNLMVPVGGAVVGGFDEYIVKEVAKTYVGRASSSQHLDVLMTLLSLGREGYLRLVSERKDVFTYLKCALLNFAETHHEIVYLTKRNPISLAMTLNSMNCDENITKLGSMLFTRGVSGCRVISTKDTKIIDSYTFKGWGSHTDAANVPYITAAAALGTTNVDVYSFINKLNKCISQFHKTTQKN